VTALQFYSVSDRRVYRPPRTNSRSVINEPWPVEEDISQAVYEVPALFLRLFRRVFVGHIGQTSGLGINNPA
jgi:hypothetical protein